MGKKKKAQRGQKEKRVATASPQSTPQTIENVVIASSKERRICSHLEKGVDLDKLTLKFSSAVPVKCDDCREGALERRAAKSSGKGKSSKRKGGSSGSQSKFDSKFIWVCLECGHFSCGGAGFPTTPESHALRHSRQYRHPLAVKLENPNLRWCFPCSSPIPVFESDEQKDLLPDIVKIIKSRPVETNSVDIEDVWFGTGTILSQIKPESDNSCKEPGGGYAVRGLVNLGNTCFFNSVMQNLLAMDKVREYFLNLDRSIGPLTVSLKKLYVETNPSSGLKNVVNPKPFFGSLCTKSPQFRGFQQHDSHELLRCLLDNLCSEEQSEQKELNSNSSKENGASLDLGPTFVDNFFGGKLSSTVCCLKCRHSSVVHEPFLDLSLPVLTKKPPPKKVQPVLKGKNPKLPPKRTGRIRPKLSRDTEMQSTSIAEAEKLASSSINSSHSSPLDSEGFKDNKLVESTLLGSPGIKNKELVENVEVEIETSSWLDFVDYGMVSNDDEIETNKLVEDVEVESETLPLDVDYGSVLNDNDKSPQTENGLAVCDDSFETSEPACSSCANEKKELPEDLSGDLNGHGKVSVENSDSAVTQDSFFRNPNNNNTQNIGSGYSSEGPVQAQDSEVILLPYKEEEKKELPVEQNTVDFSGLGNLSSDLNELGKLSVEIDDSSVTQDSFFQNPNNNITPNIGSSYSCEEPVQAQDSEVILLPYKEAERLELPVEQSTVDFDGLGDLFNEPDDVPVMGPSMRPSETTFTAGISSGSDPDEVDNSNSQVSVESCLAHFTKLEILSKNEHAWLCDSCSKSAIQRRRFKKKSLNSTDDECLSCNGDSCSVDDVDDDKNEGGDDDDDDDVGDSEDVKVKRDATKRLLIDKAPPILTVHLLRFTQDARGRLSKLKGHVAFKEVLDLRPYMNPRYTEKEKYEYRLVGVVEHSGSMRQGHYIAYVRGGPKKKTNVDDQKKPEDSPSLPSIWYHASDTHVREASFEEVLNCEAYMMFYEEI